MTSFDPCRCSQFEFLSRIGRLVKDRIHTRVVTHFVSRISRLLIEWREKNGENRGKTEEPNRGTEYKNRENREKKHMKQRETEQTEEKRT
jgi:hypothetical protein